MPKLYCQNCGFGTEYKLGSSPKSCAKCNKSTVIEVKPTPKPQVVATAPPPPTTKGKWILVDDTEKEPVTETEYKAPEIKVIGLESSVVKFGDVAHQQKTGETGRPTQKLTKKQAKEAVSSLLERAKSKRNVIEID